MRPRGKVCVYRTTVSSGEFPADKGAVILACQRTETPWMISRSDRTVVQVPIRSLPDVLAALEDQGRRLVLVGETLL